MTVLKVIIPPFVVLPLSVMPVLTAAAGFTFRPFNQHEYVPPPMNPMTYPGLPQTPGASVQTVPGQGQWSTPEPTPFYGNQPNAPAMKAPYSSSPPQSNPAAGNEYQTPSRRSTRNREIQYQGYRFRADEHTFYDNPLPPPVNQSLPANQPMGSLAPRQEGYNNFGYGYPNADFRPMEQKGNSGVPQPYVHMQSEPRQSWQGGDFRNESINSSGYNTSPSYGGSGNENYNYVPNGTGQGQSWSGYPNYGNEEIKPGW